MTIRNNPSQEEVNKIDSETNDDDVDLEVEDGESFLLQAIASQIGQYMKDAHSIFDWRKPTSPEKDDRTENSLSSGVQKISTKNKKGGTEWE